VNCLCGCGTKLDRSQVELNLLAGQVAIELVVWDKARALRSPVAAAEVDALLVDGAPHYQASLGAIHAGEELGEGEQAAIDEWLERSRAARARLHDQLSVPKKKIKLTRVEEERINRLHPERTFSGVDAPAQASDPPFEALLSTALEDVRAGRRRRRNEPCAASSRSEAERPGSASNLRRPLFA
jgi:hypothetical protein